MRGIRDGGWVMAFLTRRERDRQLHELVVEACRLVESGKDVRSVRIVARGRPTYSELRRYQESAQARCVRLSVDAGGVIAVWPMSTPRRS